MNGAEAMKACLSRLAKLEKAQAALTHISSDHEQRLRKLERAGDRGR
jgi:hypothetical protein